MNKGFAKKTSCSKRLQVLTGHNKSLPVLIMGHDITKAVPSSPSAYIQAKMINYTNIDKKYLFIFSLPFRTIVDCSLSSVYIL